MTHTKQFIEDAVAGGWLHINNYDGDWKTEQILLDPTAWQAVGKTRGWVVSFPNEEDVFSSPLKEWRYRWHSFIDHLADGKTIEEALAAISE